MDAVPSLVASTLHGPENWFATAEQTVTDYEDI